MVMDLQTLVLDFDGTLAPIRKDPSAVRLPKAMRGVLLKLVSSGLEVIILSGRSTQFLEEQDFPGEVWLRGNFGNASSARKAVFGKRFMRTLAIISRIRGIKVERKAGYTIHYRNVRQGDLERAKQLIYLAIDEAGDGASSVFGRKAVEILPPGNRPKIGFLLRLLDSRKEGVLFIGDDPSDRAAMMALSGRANFSCALVKSREVDAWEGKWPAKLVSRGALASFLLRIAERRGRGHGKAMPL